MENELRKLTRRQLLELLLEQTRNVEELQEQVEHMQKEVDENQLSKKEAGSMAEEALRLNKVFEAADAAVWQYVHQIYGFDKEDLEAVNLTYTEAQHRSIELLRETREKCIEMEKESEEKIARLEKDIRRLYTMYYEISNRLDAVKKGEKNGTE